MWSGARRGGVLVLLLALPVLSGVALGDEVRPAYLQLVEGPGNEVSVTWKVPSSVTALSVALPEACEPIVPETRRDLAGAMTRSWRVRCDEGIAGGSIHIRGLQATATDVLVRLRWLDGSWLTTRMLPAKPVFEIPARGTHVGIASTYLLLGIEHILLGFDHLLFVFGLLLIVGGWKSLIATVTSFTVAHSVTLGLATFGLVRVSQAPVEAVIALSIVFLAVEIRHKQTGREGLASRFPWCVAFAFGLLHGFGFAGALAEIGLPEQAIPLALLCFNLGVECGQLLFVGSCYALGALISRVQASSWLPPLQPMATYLLGGLATFWLLQRVAAF